MLLQCILIASIIPLGLAYFSFKAKVWSSAEALGTNWFLGNANLIDLGSRLKATEGMKTLLIDLNVL